MGLDMYLFAKKYTSKYNDEERCKKIKKLFPEIPDSGNLESIDLDFEVGYWRKANAIHKWFVDNVQNGEDDCGRYEVSKSKLKKLLDICNKVLEGSELIDGQVQNGYTYKEGKKQPIIEEGKTIKDIAVAEDLLPSQSGFFFGSTCYDQWYLRDVEYTAEILQKLVDSDLEEFEYQSSW